MDRAGTGRSHSVARGGTGIRVSFSDDNMGTPSPVTSVGFYSASPSGLRMSLEQANCRAASARQEDAWTALCWAQVRGSEVFRLLPGS